MNDQLIGELLMVELEIMDLYKKEFNRNPCGNVEYKRYTRDEQVERYAKNAAFWNKLYIKHCSHEVLSQEPKPPTNKNKKKLKAVFSDPYYIYIKKRVTNSDLVYI